MVVALLLWNNTCKFRMINIYLLGFALAPKCASLELPTIAITARAAATRLQRGYSRASPNNRRYQTLYCPVRRGCTLDIAAFTLTVLRCCVRDNNESAKKSAENINESSGQTRNKKVHCVDAKVLVLSVFESFTRKATIQTPDQSPWDAYSSGRGAFQREEYPMNST